MSGSRIAPPVQPVVIDANVWISRLIPGEVHHAASAYWFNSYIAAGGALVVPVLLLVEVAGGIARRTGDATLGDQAVDELLNLPGVQIVNLDQPLATRAAEIAAELRLRGADAAYVAAADYLNVPLVTWDREQLARATGRIAVRTP